jgi:hypothetical protein
MCRGYGQKKEQKEQGLDVFPLGWEQGREPIVTHHAPSMARVQNPANTFGEAIAEIDDTLYLL